MNDKNSSSIFEKGEKLSDEYFKGNAYLSTLLVKDKNNNFIIGAVTFEPNARTNWHTHPKGQVLIVIEGEGIYKEKNKSAQSIKKGDVINIPENVVHWHGATTTTKMVHIAITNYEGETNANWLQPVTDEEFTATN
ncbi:cupin domain-containing protein [Flavobacterium sp. SUN052]|uniref:cupin domain-containing protein n=1 Tax=Flavobacterium sp. SUN052 TaxID=3002441 RepID=UPI00237D8DE3|nr:cupin domain-containing protein [Flavobacterium sp. SUN052]MEC4003724.1 cupin domain-containing protein [Flavobacterium sp. SUN052]